MPCSDFCTAAKCQELEYRLGQLEFKYESLEAAFEAHVSQAIPEAHDYKPQVEVKVLNIVPGDEKIIEVIVDGEKGFDKLSELDSTLEVSLNITPEDNLNYLFELTINDVVTESTLTIPDLEIKDILVDLSTINELSVTLHQGDNLIYGSTPLSESNLKIDGSFQSETLTLTIADGLSLDSTIIPIPATEFDNQHVESNLKISGSYYNNLLTLTVSDGESFDTDQVLMNFGSDNYEAFTILDNHVPSNLKLEGSFHKDILTLTVADGESFDTAQIELFMDCDFSEILTAINNTETNLSDKIKLVEDEVKTSVETELLSNFSFEFAVDEETGETIPTYAQSKSDKQEYEFTGVGGLYQSLNLLHSKIDSVYNDTVKAIDPISTITYNDFYRFCNDSGIKREDYSETDEGEEQYIQALEQYLYNLLIDSKYGYLVENIDLNSTLDLITAPNNWITPIISDFSLIQSRINNTAICDIDIPEEADVVSIVASDKVLGKAQGKFLKLHLVTFDNYPKRSRNSTYWPIQIPEAKETYDWNTDFKDLVWRRGNLYAEMYFENIKDPVSGYFLDQDSANSWFDSILPLTNGVERNRKYHEQLNPTRNISEIITRPYRAFLISINDAGRSLCHLKFVPPKETDES